MKILIKRLALSLAPLLLLGPLTQALAQTCPEVSAIPLPDQRGDAIDMPDWSANNNNVSAQDREKLSFDSVMLAKEGEQNIVTCDYVFEDQKENQKKGFMLEFKTDRSIEKTGNGWDASETEDDIAICEKGIEDCAFEVK